MKNSEYDTIKNFFLGTTNYEQLGSLKYLIKDFDQADSKLTLQQLGRQTDLKHRLLADGILTGDIISKLEREKYFTNKIASGNTFKFSKRGAKIDWRAKIDEIYEQTGKLSNPDSTRSDFRAAMIVTLMSSDTPLAQEFRKDNLIDVLPFETANSLLGYLENTDHRYLNNAAADILTKSFGSTNHYLDTISSIYWTEEEEEDRVDVAIRSYSFYASVVKSAKDEFDHVYDVDARFKSLKEYELNRARIDLSADLPGISEMGKAEYYDNLMWERFKADYIDKVFELETSGMETTWRRRLPHYYEELASEHTDVGFSFRKTFGLSELWKDGNTDMIDVKIGNLAGNKSFYDMVKENPGLDNRALLAIYEKVPLETLEQSLKNKPGGRTVEEYDTTLWDEARKDIDLLYEAKNPPPPIPEIIDTTVEDTDKALWAKFGRPDEENPFVWNETYERPGWIDDFDEYKMPLLEETKSALTEYWEEFPSEFMEGYQVLENRLSLNVSKFTKWMEAYKPKITAVGSSVASSLTAAAVVTTITMMLGDLANLNPKQRDVLDFTVAETLGGLQLTSAIVSGGPVGIALGVIAVAALPIYKLIKHLTHHRDILSENLHPEKIFGKQMGYVRIFDNDAGKLKWYPAILEQNTTRSFGNTLRFQYGDPKNFRFKLNTDGTVTPYFLKKLERIYDAKDFSFNNKSGNVIEGVEFDPSQDWSLLSEEQTQNTFTDLLAGKSSKVLQTRFEDSSKYSGYYQDSLEMKSLMQYIQQLNYGDYGIGRGVNAADKAYHWGIMDNQILTHVMVAKNWDRSQYWKYKDKFKENGALLDYFNDLVKKTQHAQQVASRSDKSFDVSKEQGGEYAYMNYFIDIGKNPPDTVQELVKQNIDLNNLSQYNDLQRNYLVLKNSTRYLLAKLSDRGLGEDIILKAVGKTGKQHGELERFGHPIPGAFSFNLGNKEYAPVTYVDGYNLSMNQAGVVGGTDVETWSPPPVWLDSTDTLIPEWLYIPDDVKNIVDRVRSFTRRGDTHNLLKTDEIVEKIKSGEFMGPAFVDAFNKDDEYFKNNKLYQWVPDLEQYVEIKSLVTGIVRDKSKHKEIKSPPLKHPVSKTPEVENDKITGFITDVTKKHADKASKPQKHPQHSDPNLNETDEQIARLITAGYNDLDDRPRELNGYRRNPQFDSEYVSVWDTRSERIIIVRGTKPSHGKDILQDLQILVTGHAGNLVGDELKNIVSLTEPGKNISVAGHSLGTTLTAKAYIEDPDLKSKISNTYLFNPPYNLFGQGANRHLEDDPSVRYFFNDKDLVSLTRFGALPKNTVVLKPTDSIVNILAHHEVTQWEGTKPTENQIEAQDILRESFGIKENDPSKITKDKYKQFSYGGDGDVILKDDPTLHDEYKIQEHYTAAIVNNVLHTMYQPTEVVPKFTHQKMIVAKDTN